MTDHDLGLSLDAVVANMVRDTVPAYSYARKPKRQSFVAWQVALRARLCEVLGLGAQASRLPRSSSHEAGGTPALPAVHIVEDVACKGYHRKRGYLTAADGLALPFYVLEPSPSTGNAVGVCIAVHGHGPGKSELAGVNEDGSVREGQVDTNGAYGLEAVRRGYLTLIPDLRGMGELLLHEDLLAGRSSCLQLACRSAQCGKPLMGQRVSDLQQLLDWALANYTVDSTRVVITGTSGGGTLTLFTAAVDTRITLAAPTSYFSTFAGSILSLYHCPCNFTPGLQEVAEMSDLAGLIAPRPFIIVAGTRDPLFPIDAVREGYAAARQIYADAGAEQNIELVEMPGGHNYYAEPVWAFIAQHTH